MTLLSPRRLLSLVAIAIGAHAVPAAAADTLFKPGLWEIATKPGGASAGPMQAMMAQMQERMRTMPAADRARVEAAMARNGVTVENGSMTAKVCITPAMAQRQQLPMQRRGSCDFQSSPPVGKTVSFSMSCTNPNIVSEGSATFSDPTHYTATSRTTGGVGGSAAANANASMTMESTGRWVGAECGSIQPADSGK